MKSNMGIIRNYQKELDKIIGSIDKCSPPKLMLHSCCAPCSSYVLEYLRPFFAITVFYYNPNIYPDEEYRKRVAEQKRLIADYNAGIMNAKAQKITADSSDNCYEVSTTAYPIDIIEGDYEPDEFFSAVKGLEDCPEGGERCSVCYEMRIRKTSQMALKRKCDYFATTLTISPLKNAVKINDIGERIAGECGVRWLPSDFKKKGGYQRSIELSKEYGLYRQNYCGCVYSKRERGENISQNEEKE